MGAAAVGKEEREAGPDEGNGAEGAREGAGRGQKAAGGLPGEAGGEGDASTWVLVANTGATEQRVRFTLLTETGPGRSIEDVVSGNGRYTLSAAGSFPEATGTRFSILVEAIDAAAPLVVERASYSSTRSTTWAAGTNALAMALP